MQSVQEKKPRCDAIVVAVPWRLKGYVHGEERERERETTSDLVGPTHLGEGEIEAT